MNKFQHENEEFIRTKQLLGLGPIQEIGAVDCGQLMYAENSDINHSHKKMYLPI